MPPATVSSSPGSAGPSCSKSASSRSSRSAPQFVHGIEREGSGLRHVFEAAAERIVVTDGGPVDPHGRVDSGLDVLGIYVAALRPAVVNRIGPAGIGLAD